MTLRIVGVRHHSPACARLVEHVLRKVRPAQVLVEGPADFNPRLDELLLPHRLPVALFSYYQGPERTHASWAPFCRHSPEWVALTVGRELGAAVRFVDLPAWDNAFAAVRNRYRDRPDRAAEYVAALCRRLAVDDSDTLWDHLFEQPMPCAELDVRLAAYFLALRAEDPADERDLPREAFMAAHVRAALASAGDVVVVCGGYHAPALARLAQQAEPTATAPAAPLPADGARHGTYLVPYSFRRLDSFVGYESGLPSPAFYDALWEHGEAAGELLLRRTTERLRRKRQPVSPADLIACLSLARGLARARGHATLARTDLLDGIAGALVKDALDVPLPWSYRGTLLPRTDPTLVEVVAAFSGDVEGALAAGTPRPPLLADVATQLLAEGLAPRAESFTVTLDLHREVPRSRLLHRLRVLGIPGFQRLEGPAWATDAELREVWEVRQVFETESALIEAAAWGANLESAAAARLEEALGEAGSLARLAALLGEAVFVGIEGLSGRLLVALATGVEREPSFGELGEAGRRLLALFRHDDLLGARGSATLGEVLTAVAERGLWLLEGLAGGTAPADERELRGMVLLRDLARFAVGSSRVDLQACKLEYSIVSPK